MKTARDYFVNMGKNFMTPRILKYGYTGRYAYELSQGTGFDRKPIFGVTLYDVLASCRDYDKSRCFTDKVAASAYLRELAAEDKAKNK